MGIWENKKDLYFFYHKTCIYTNYFVPLQAKYYNFVH